VTKVAIIGQGYVGLPIAVHAAKAGYEVVGFDLNSKLVSDLNSGKSHIEDISDNELAEITQSGSYTATNNPEDISGAEIAVIAVPTPLDDNREPDLSFIESACDILAKNLSVSALIINESTSYPGTLRNLIARRIDENSSISHRYAISPERVDPGNKDWGIENTPRLYAGLTREAAVETQIFYANFCKNLIEVSSPEVAEAAKLFENSFRQVNIALVNELALISRTLGISVREVLEAADSKPYGFMKFNPGLGVGGHCIPVDPTYLAFAAKKGGTTAAFIELANKVNLEMPEKIVQRIKSENGGDISGKKILVCGISYKKDVADVRESPSIRLIETLKREKANVVWHDPVVSKYNGEVSTDLGSKKFDITVLAIYHKKMDLNLISKSSDYVFDCLGLLKSAVQL
jgi:UDP-N-acetyl-D-glucosamine dehydrogenase